MEFTIGSGECLREPFSLKYRHEMEYVWNIISSTPERVPPHLQLCVRDCLPTSLIGSIQPLPVWSFHHVRMLYKTRTSSYMSSLPRLFSKKYAPSQKVLHSSPFTLLRLNSYRIFFLCPSEPLAYTHTPSLSSQCWTQVANEVS